MDYNRIFEEDDDYSIGGEEIDLQKEAIKEAVKKLIQDNYWDPKEVTTKKDPLYGYRVQKGEQEWWFLTEKEANDAFHDKKILSIETDGLGGFVKKYRDKIADKFVKKQWFKKALKRRQKEYINSLEKEPADSNRYENRLEQEMAKADVSSPQKFYRHLLRKAGDPIKYYKEQFGDEFTNIIEDQDLIDWDLVIEDIRKESGRGDALASYDGEEHEFENIFYYRVR